MEDHCYESMFYKKRGNAGLLLTEVSSRKYQQTAALLYTHPPPRGAAAQRGQWPSHFLGF